MPPKQRKIAVMGYRSVGKSSLTIQYVEARFVDSYEPTIENTFTKTTKVNGQEYFIKLVDTAGQRKNFWLPGGRRTVSEYGPEDEFSIFPQSYSMDIHGYVLVYSITSERSFEIVKSIHHRLLDMTGKVQVPIVLVGNKVDLHMERTVSYEDGKRAAASMNAEFLEASAKHNESVTDIFKRIILEIEKANGNVQEKSNCVVS
ncbi:GTP-binding protein Rheb [Trichonephila inaurata madagascariensis]|uniref:GTP-binding protein Rheb n=1 Tax=Trichonephila inaurata madagascariensis TaxID=2747483 RepID=A0A8X6YSW7_9ARAC|nr:GTP-binding protein Rheb [Trichonephila inaurata madagascariensis]